MTTNTKRRDVLPGQIYESTDPPTRRLTVLQVTSGDRYADCRIDNSRKTIRLLASRLRSHAYRLTVDPGRLL